VAKKINEAAALHLAAGALKDQDVPVGNHDLSNAQITITFPEFAAVVRSAGSTNDGFDEVAAPSPAKAIGLAAVLLFLRRCMPAVHGGHAIALWSECIRESIERASKPEELMPVEATEALKVVQEALQAKGETVTAKRRTPAKRVGAEGVTFAIKRLPKPKANPKG
jgi:hypothetical protein